MTQAGLASVPGQGHLVFILVQVVTMSSPVAGVRPGSLLQLSSFNQCKGNEGIDRVLGVM